MSDETVVQTAKIRARLKEETDFGYRFHFAFVEVEGEMFGPLTIDVYTSEEGRMGDLITMDLEEFQKRWYELTGASEPKRVFMRDGQLVAGEDINFGDVVYLKGSGESDEVTDRCSEPLEFLGISIISDETMPPGEAELRTVDCAVRIVNLESPGEILQLPKDEEAESYGKTEAKQAKPAHISQRPEISEPEKGV